MNTPPSPQTSDESFTKYKNQATALIRSWTNFRDEEISRQRAARRLDVDQDDLRASGHISSDELVIPSRTIDTNIQRTLPTYVSYLNAPRVAKFTNIKSPGVSGEKVLEREFSRVFKYKDWYNPFLSTIDGAHAYGWDSVEVVYDPSKPGHFSIQHVGIDKLIFVRGIKNIQFSPLIMRQITYTKMQLDNFVKAFDWDPVAVRELTDNLSARQQNQSIVDDTVTELATYDVYKMMFKKDGIVQVAWFSTKIERWLKAPVQLYIGVDIQDQETLEWQKRAETQYPYVPLFFVRSEQEEIDEHRGRAFYDLPTQDGVTALMTDLIKGTHKSASVYGSPVRTMTSDAMPELLSLKLEPDRLYSSEVKFWAPPYPDNVMISAINMFQAWNQQQSGQVDYAAQNRKDSRKTAREIESAENSASELSSVQTLLYSMFMTNVIHTVWDIVKTCAIQQLFPFAHSDELGQNDIELLSARYNIEAAGGSDVLQRNITLHRMRADIPLFQTTAIGADFMGAYLRLAYPDEGDKFATKLEELGSRDTALVNALSTALSGIIEDPQIQQIIGPESLAQLQSMLQQTQIKPGQPEQ